MEKDRVKCIQYGGGTSFKNSENGKAIRLTPILLKRSRKIQIDTLVIGMPYVSVLHQLATKSKGL